MKSNINLLISGIILSSIFSNASYASAEVCKNDFGEMKCGIGEIDNINHMGNLTLSGTHVKKQVSVLGDFKATNAIIGSGNITGDSTLSHLIVHNDFYSVGIFTTNNSEFSSHTKIIGDFSGSKDLFDNQTEIIGDAKLDQDVFKSSATFIGTVTAKSSQFTSPISIHACHATFQSSTLSQIQVSKEQNCPNQTQDIYLSNMTHTNGNIEFAGNKGIIHLSQNSTFNGHVIGGKIIRE